MGAVIQDRRTPGRTIWTIKFKDVDGRFRRLRTKAATKKFARRLLFDREDAVERARRLGLSSVDEYLAPKPLPTFASFGEEYLRHCDVKLAAGTVERYRVAWRLYLLPAFGGKRLRDIRAADIQAYCDCRLEAGASKSTAHQELSVLSGLFSHAVRLDVLDRNPVRRVQQPRPDRTITRLLTNDEEARLLAVAPEPLRSAVVLSLNLGLRDGEVRALKWEDVSFEENVAVIRHTKAKRDRMVPLNETARALLAAVPRGAGGLYVIANPRTGRPYRFKLTNSAWKSSLRKAGIVNLRYHDLRHACASRLAAAGVPAIAIMEIMGHSSLNVTQRYMHLSRRDLHEAMARLDRTREDLPEHSALTGGGSPVPSAGSGQEG